MKIHRGPLETLSGTMLHLLDGDAAAIVVEDVLSSRICDEIVQYFSASPYQEEIFPFYQGWSELIFLTNSLEKYHHRIHPFLQDVEQWAVEEKVIALFSGLNNDCEVRRCRDRTGRSLLPFSLKELAIGGYIPLHSEHYGWPHYDWIRANIDTEKQLSFYVQIQDAEDGGLLRMYTEELADFSCDAQLARDLSPEEIERRFPELPFLDIELSQGDAVVFDGGRFNHTVTTVGGSRSRWTLGAFVGHKNGALYVWS